MTPADHMLGEYDYVVVGGGTAGCIVAARLVEAGHSVVLLEAGGSYRRILDIPLPGLWAWLRQPDRYCWNHSTVAQASLAGRRIWFPGGRLIGGSSAINAMLYSRGHPGSYDRWAVQGWRYQDLLPYHRRAEDHDEGATDWHGSGGPIGTSSPRHRSPMARAFLDACVEQGIDLNPDLNGERATGAAFLPVSQRHGRRSSTGNTYFARAARQPGLHHATNALATRILVEGNRATGVDVVVHGAPRRIRASREVIVSAGAVHTPQLLMLSGIGPADMLHGLGIPVVADRPAVGQSLQDQLRVPVAYRHRNGSPARLDRLLVGGAAYLLVRRGLLASNVCDAGAVIDTGGSGIPDVRLVFRWHVFPESGLPLVDLEVTMLTPASRGRVTINSTNPLDEPVVDPAYLSAPDDLAILERGIAWARRIAGARAMRAAGIEGEYAPGDATIIDHVRHHAASAFHPVGTCRMGHDPDSVVDPALRVRGIDGLRVVDASVIPSCVAGNAQASVMAVAEKAADLVTGVLPA